VTRTYSKPIAEESIEPCRRTSALVPVELVEPHRNSAAPPDRISVTTSVNHEASIRSRTGSLDAASVATCLYGMANSRKELGEHGK
jgi:hypothetical protein